MIKRNFPVHGDMKFEIEGRLLRIQGDGPGNMEAILIYQREVQKFREQLAKSPWASLVELSGEPMLPPEATNMMIETIKHAKTLNLVATAVVFVDVEFAESIKLFWQGIYNQAQLEYGFFEHVEDARAWLHERVAAADTSS